MYNTCCSAPSLCHIGSNEASNTIFSDNKKMSFIYALKNFSRFRHETKFKLRKKYLPIVTKLNSMRDIISFNLEKIVKKLTFVFGKNVSYFFSLKEKKKIK